MNFGPDYLEFTDNLGQFDRERIVDHREGEFITRTEFSRHANGGGEAVGTRWRYVLVEDGKFRVENMSRSRQFFLTRCPSSQ